MEKKMESIKSCTTKKGVPNFTKEEVVNLALKYYKSNGKIILRDFINKNGLPSSYIVTKLFGSFENFLKEAAIPIKEDKLHNFGRQLLTDEEMLNVLKNFTDKYLQTHIYLPINDEIDKNKSIPSCSAYISRFSSFDNAYKLIGYDVKEFNNSALEKDMIKKYKDMCYKLSCTLNSREITKLSKANKECIYSTETYNNHFGTIHNLQEKCGFVKTVIGKGMTKEESLICLNKLVKMLQHIPTQKELDLYDFVPSGTYYFKKFGSYNNALKQIGLKSTKMYITKNGTKCNSSYEYKVALVLEHYKYEFKKEICYKKVINNFKRNYRFDFEIIHDNKKYYIEVFGITNNKKYNERKQEKIQLCIDNNIKLIEIYKDDIFGKTHKEVNDFIQNKIKTFKEKEELNE